jgi:hypothetical protein
MIFSFLPLRFYISFFAPTCYKARGERKINTDKDIEQQVGEVEHISRHESALFEEYEREPGTGNIVSAGGYSQQGWQATV